jgi:AcrR family transcriptional regulator
MDRWAPDARGRLERAALELYGEHGFDSTTVAEIAERAGLTERTFFRMRSHAAAAITQRAERRSQR